jgi:hypothetical protein
MPTGRRQPAARRLRAVRAAAVLGLLLATHFGLAQALRVTGEVPREFSAGDSGEIHLSFLLDDPTGQIERGVLFLNIVVNSAERGWPQAGHLVFSGASERPALFRRTLEATELQAGVETVLEFTTRGRAPPGDYVLVLQLFEGNQTDPHRVRVEDRIGQVGFPFRIVEAAVPAAEAGF